MARAKTKQEKPPPPPLLVRSLTLTPATEAIIEQLASDASDFIGWTVSKSALMRALIHYAAEQPPAWATAHLFSLVESEIASGRAWGKKQGQKSELVSHKESPALLGGDIHRPDYWSYEKCYFCTSALGGFKQVACFLFSRRFQVRVSEKS